jgi:hypothetical protein
MLRATVKDCPYINLTMNDKLYTMNKNGQRY